MFKSISRGRFEQVSLRHGNDLVHLLITKYQMVDFTYNLFVGCKYNCEGLEHLHVRVHYQQEMQGKCMARPLLPPFRCPRLLTQKLRPAHLVSRCTWQRGPPRSRVLHATSQRAGAPPSLPGLSPRPGLHSRWSSSNSPGKQATPSASVTSTCPFHMQNVLSNGKQLSSLHAHRRWLFLLFYLNSISLT